MRIEPESVTVELDEDYQAGSKVKARSHFLDEFTASAGVIDHRITISDVEAPGLLGFFYRTFGSSNIGGERSCNRTKPVLRKALRSPTGCLANQRLQQTRRTER